MADHANIFDDDGVTPPSAPADPWNDNVKLRAAVIHGQHEVGKLHSQIDRLKSDLAATIAANAALVVRLEEARVVMKYIAKTWPDTFAARDARAFLAGGAA